MSNEVFQKPAGKLESLSKEMGYDVPVDSVILPSRGVVYPSDSQLSNLEEVQIKCMTAKEEDLLTSRALIKAGTVLTALCKSCLINKAIEPEEMLVGDRNAILLSIRVTGYGADYGASMQCPECSNRFDNTFSFATLGIKRLGAEPLQPNTNKFKFQLPLSKLEVVFKLLTVKDERDISEESESRKKVSQIDNVITARLCKTVLSIGGETNPDEIRKKVTNLRAGDARALRDYMTKIEPGIDMRQKAKCPHCSVESEVDIPIGMDFFWPDIAK